MAKFHCSWLSMTTELSRLRLRRMPFSVFQFAVNAVAKCFDIPVIYHKFLKVFSQLLRTTLGNALKIDKSIKSTLFMATEPQQVLIDGTR